MSKLLIFLLLIVTNVFATNFVFYGTGSTNTGTTLLAQDRQGAVTLPSSLPTDEVYMMWGTNSFGYGEPVMINAAELWWVGFDVIEVGEQFSVYGRNLSFGEGGSYLYCVEKNEWLTSSVGNPYKVTYTAPVEWGAGTYTLYAHNGKGGKYGWSESVTLTIADNYPTWNTTTNNVRDVIFAGGAVGDGVANDQAAVQSAINASSSGDTVYFPAGEYGIGTSRLEFKGGIRVVGDGTNSIIKGISSFNQSGEAVISGSLSGTLFKDIQFLDGDVTDFSEPFGFFNSSYVTFDNVLFQQLSTTATDRLLAFSFNCSHFLFTNCTFVGRDTVFSDASDQVRFIDCQFLGVRDNNQILTIGGAEGIDITGCTATHLDNSDTSSGYGWAKGRWVVDKGGCYGVFFGDNETIDMVNRFETPFFTNGVVTSYSALGAETWVFSLGNVRSCTYTFTDIPSEFDGRGNGSSDFDGARVFLPIDPDDGNLDNDFIGGYVITLDATANTIAMWVKEGSYALWDRQSASSTVSAIVIDIVDDNSGEQYLFEGSSTRFSGSPTSWTSNTATFSDASLLISPTDTMSLAMVIDGKGMGQSRRISSVTDLTGNVGRINLAESWRVEPDANSVIQIGNIETRHVFYNNRFDGTPSVTGPSQFAAAGVQTYGSASEIVIENNTFNEMRTGVQLTSLGSSTDFPNGYSTIGNNMFIYVNSNAFYDCRTSILAANSLVSTDYPVWDSASPTVGNLYSQNYSSNNISTFFHGSFDASTTNNQSFMGVFDGNEIADTATNSIYSGAYTNQVWVGNTTNGVSWNP